MTIISCISGELKFAANDSSDGKNRLPKKKKLKILQPQKRKMLKTVTKAFDAQRPYV